jgi:hypothetical protein
MVSAKPVAGEAINTIHHRGECGKIMRFNSVISTGVISAGHDGGTTMNETSSSERAIQDRALQDVQLNSSPDRDELDQDELDQDELDRDEVSSDEVPNEPGGLMGAVDEQVDRSLTPPAPEESVEKVSD